MFTASILGVLLNGVVAVATDPEPYTPPVPVNPKAGLTCNADGRPSADGLVCHPQRKEVAHEKQ